MDQQPKRLALDAYEIPPRTSNTSYPEPFRCRVEGREKRQLGNAFGLKNFGVNMTRLAPGSESSIMHKHSVQEEFVFVLDGHPTLITEELEQDLEPGMCVGFVPGESAHHFVNRTEVPATLLEIGDRSAGDTGSYPSDDLVAVMTYGEWAFYRKDGSAYED